MACQYKKNLISLAHLYSVKCSLDGTTSVIILLFFVLFAGDASFWQCSFMKFNSLIIWWGFSVVFFIKYCYFSNNLRLNLIISHFGWHIALETQMRCPVHSVLFLPMVSALLLPKHYSGWTPRNYKNEIFSRYWMAMSHSRDKWVFCLYF